MSDKFFIHIAFVVKNCKLHCKLGYDARYMQKQIAAL
jgi:hypothetical protein